MIIAIEGPAFERKECVGALALKCGSSGLAKSGHAKQAGLPVDDPEARAERCHPSARVRTPFVFADSEREIEGRSWIALEEDVEISAKLLPRQAREHLRNPTKILGDESQRNGQVVCAVGNCLLGDSGEACPHCGGEIRCGAVRDLEDTLDAQPVAQEVHRGQEEARTEV